MSSVDRIGTEFSDVHLLLRRWYAAAINDVLPPYEELALGSVGRFADEVAVVVCRPDEEPLILRAGDRLAELVGLQGPSVALSALPTGFRLAIASAIENARAAAAPRLALCRWLVEGLVATIEVIALPLACRWPGEHILLFLRPRKSRLNLARLLVNSTREGIMGLSPVYDREGDAPTDFHILSINDAVGRFLDEPSDALQFTRLSDVLARKGVGQIPQELIDAAVKGRFSRFELAFHLRDGAMALQVGVNAADGILVVTLTDIRDIKARETLFRSLFDENPAPMFVRRPNMPGFLDVNGAALRLYGYGREEFLTRDLSAIRVEAAAGDATEDSGTVTRHRTADGRHLDVIEYASEIAVDDQAATLSTVVDITERRRAEAHITFLAHHDPLTGVGNRALFTREIERAMNGLLQDGRPFALVLIDLDDFKLINDTLGHAAGDAVLTAITERLKSLVGRTDVLARLGGDEFAILMPGVDSREEIEALAARIREAVTSLRRIGGADISIGASVGAAIAPDDAMDAETLLQCADFALYRVKQNGKGALRFFEPEMTRQIRERRALEAELRTADIENEFHLHYQPILSVDTGRLRGFEALVRWDNPRRGMIPPADFIPVAEETGMLEGIGRFVLADACRAAAAWPDSLIVAVNVSPAQFRTGDLIRTVEHALRWSGLRPDRLELEITESVLLADSAANLSVLHKLREHGIRIALDDFGTGYSSMSYLRRFPFSRLKIDRSFIREVTESPESLAIVRAIIGLGKSLAIDTTAEGVETAAQLETLRAERCDELQGYFFSPPVPETHLSGIIRAYFGDEAVPRVA